MRGHHRKVRVGRLCLGVSFFFGRSTALQTSHSSQRQHTSFVHDREFRDTSQTLILPFDFNKIPQLRRTIFWFSSADQTSK